MEFLEISPIFSSNFQYFPMEFTGLYPITENAGILHGFSPMPAWKTSSEVPLDFLRLI
jgi:hypothetical protein